MNTQPPEQQRTRQQQAGDNSLSQSAGNKAQIQTDNETSTTNNAQQSKQNDEDKTFQKTQIRQYWVLVITSIVTTVALIVYTIFAILQWVQIRKQAEHAGKQTETSIYQMYLNARGWIAVRDIDLKDGYLVVSFKNAGHVPSRIAKFSYDIQWSATDKIDLTPQRPLPLESIEVPPEGELPIRIQIEPKITEHIKSENGYIFIVGRVAYETMADPRMIYCFKYRYDKVFGWIPIMQNTPLIEKNEDCYAEPQKAN